MTLLTIRIYLVYNLTYRRFTINIYLNYYTRLVLMFRHRLDCKKIGERREKSQSHRTVDTGHKRS